MDVFPSVQPEHLMEFHLEVQAKYFSKDTLEILLQQPNEVRNWGEFDLLSTPLIPSINPAKYALLLQKYAMPQSQGMFASVHTRQQKSGAVPVSGAQLRPEDACASVGNFCESPTSDEEPEGRGKASVMVQTDRDSTCPGITPSAADEPGYVNPGRLHRDKPLHGSSPRFLACFSPLSLSGKGCAIFWNGLERFCEIHLQKPP